MSCPSFGPVSAAALELLELQALLSQMLYVSVENPIGCVRVCVSCNHLDLAIDQFISSSSSSQPCIAVEWSVSDKQWRHLQLLHIPITLTNFLPLQNCSQRVSLSDVRKYQRFPRKRCERKVSFKGRQRCWGRRVCFFTARKACGHIQRGFGGPTVAIIRPKGF